MNALPVAENAILSGFMIWRMLCICYNNCILLFFLHHQSTSIRDKLKKQIPVVLRPHIPCVEWTRPCIIDRIGPYVVRWGRNTRSAPDSIMCLYIFQLIGGIRWAQNQHVLHYVFKEVDTVVIVCLIQCFDNFHRQLTFDLACCSVLFTTGWLGLNH